MKRLLFIVALCLVSFTPKTSAGDVPLGGYCSDEACVQSNPAPKGCYWNPEGGYYHLHCD